MKVVELNVNMHCDACAHQLKKKILKMRGGLPLNSTSDIINELLIMMMEIN